MNTMIKSLLTLTTAALLLTSGAAMAGKPYNPQPVLLHSMHMMYDEATYPYGDALSIEVTSKGCTTKEDLSVRNWVNRGRTYIEVLRINPDQCGAESFKQVLTYTHEEIRLLKSHTILNKMGAFTGE